MPSSSLSSSGRLRLRSCSLAAVIGVRVSGRALGVSGSSLVHQIILAGPRWRWHSVPVPVVGPAWGQPKALAAPRQRRCRTCAWCCPALF